ncbi:MAG: thiamine pyrophosphate-dependent enzyme, partial [Dehalococcoidales bacterium]|nr:thiamine pyrophosphate-dependent enzyme [Dehalococcoidales bacterium]
MPRLLDKIDSPSDLKGLAPAQLEQLAAELRDEIISTVTSTGGHLASNLGVVELTIALHRVFDSPHDKLIWDVGHQSYVHKLLTGRREGFRTLRQYGGLSGFTTREESDHDPFGTGHASTSVSAALGMAVARDLTGDNCRVIAVIGDGAMTAGMAYEAMNHAGHLGSRLIVILNDNGMSISPTVGALAKLLSRLRFAKNLYKARRTGQKIVSILPKGKTLWKWWQKLEDRAKGFFSASPIWEELGFTYIGPIDGHNLNDLESVLTQVKTSYSKPTLVHVITTKGKGHTPAESNAIYFHGVSAKGGSRNEIPTYSEVFAQTM